MIPTSSTEVATSNCWCGEGSSGGGSGIATRDAVGGDAVVISGGTSVLDQPYRNSREGLNGCMGGRVANSNNRLSTATALPPRNDQNHELDDIASALTQLSVQEREQVYDDLHGVGGDNVDFVNCEDGGDGRVTSSLKKLEMELLHLSSKQPNCAYQLARSRSTTYVQDRNFQLMFLRADEWDARAAARRMIGFLQQKLQIFGIDMLTKPRITLDDLLEHDDKDGEGHEHNDNGNTDVMEILESGFVQQLPLKDRSGRVIVLFTPQFSPSARTKSVLKCLYYVMMAVFQDSVEVQQKGLIELSYQIRYHSSVAGAGVPPSSSLFFQIYALRSVLPIRTAAVHTCTNDPNVGLVVKFLRPLLSLQVLSRIRIHSGRLTEIKYELLSFGVPQEALPISHGVLCTASHHAWIQGRRLKENQFQQEQDGDAGSVQKREEVAQAASTVPVRIVATGNNGSASMATKSSASKLGKVMGDLNMKTNHQKGCGDIVYQPESWDVLLGRGKAIDNHPGNQRFRQFLQLHLPLYENASRSKKRIVAQQMLDKINVIEVRFLKPFDSNNDKSGKRAGLTDGGLAGTWEIADDDTILEKICRTFRRLRESSMAARPPPRN